MIETVENAISLIPARMLNEYVYCPRLAWLEWVESEFDDNWFTVDGRRVHRRVDGGKGELPEDSDSEEPLQSRSVMLSSDTEGLIARMDLVETDGNEAVPVDYKRGHSPDIPEGAYEPERVQLCAQGLILRDNGYRCQYGQIYFAASKTHVRITFSEELIARTRELVLLMKEAVQKDVRPEPLSDSPKCDGCSLVGICLPDETAFLKAGEFCHKDGLRRLTPARDDALPLYVQQHGLRVGKSGNEFVVKQKKEVVAKARFVNTSQVSLFGNIGISAQALHECFNRSIPVCHFSRGGYFYGISCGIGLRNAELKRVQFRVADDKTKCLDLARRFVTAKVANQRTLLRRNYTGAPKQALDQLSESTKAGYDAKSIPALLGVEGFAARTYFEHFSGMLKAPNEPMTFDFNGRNRRPPTDPVNAMLSFVYSILAKDCTITLMAVGFEPFSGFYHQPRFGRPALALDFMEEFRPIIADSVVLSVINNGIVRPGDFYRAAKSVSMNESARKAVLSAYERRMDTLVTHPVFGYRISYRRVLSVQARLLARYLVGELESWPPFLPR